jgi:hypothetical protein
MPCPASPEPDGYHRYQMAPQGTDVHAGYTTRCLHCGEEKQVRPQPLPHLWATVQARGLAASRAAQRAKRETP